VLGALAACIVMLIMRVQELERRIDEERGRVDPRVLQQHGSFAVLSSAGADIDVDGLIFDAEQYSMGIVSDLDKASASPSKPNTWYSILQRAELLRDIGSDTWDVSWGGHTILETHTANNNRSMELSELVQYRGRLLGMCDRTGILYKIDLSTGAAWPRWAIADGDGDEPKPFKGEWATVKNGKLWVGSPGVKWWAPANPLASRGPRKGRALLNRNPEWVKQMDERGHIVNHDWGPVYAALRRVMGVSKDGYVWHEAVHWDSVNRLWVFLPRRWSRTEPHDELLDERRGANFLLLASETFDNITLRELGPLEPEWGWTSVRKVLGTADVYVGLKCKEVKGEPMETKLAVFDLHGRFKLEPPFVAVPGENVKFEGVEFLGVPSMYRALSGLGSDPSVSKEECKRRMQARMLEHSTSLLSPASQEMSHSLIDT